MCDVEVGPILGSYLTLLSTASSRDKAHSSCNLAILLLNGLSIQVRNGTITYLFLVQCSSLHCRESLNRKTTQ
jgi:hypothetical protein